MAGRFPEFVSAVEKFLTEHNGRGPNSVEEIAHYMRYPPISYNTFRRYRDKAVTMKVPSECMWRLNAHAKEVRILTEDSITIMSLVRYCRELLSRVGEGCCGRVNQDFVCKARELLIQHRDELETLMTLGRQ